MAPNENDHPKGPGKATSCKKPAKKATARGTTTTRKRAKRSAKHANIASDPRPTKKQKTQKENTDGEDDDRKGLDRSLSPISCIDSAIKDLVARTNGMLPTDTNQVFLRVATMCSGTEAPIEALRMLQDGHRWLNPNKGYISFDHVFSVEVVPYKQLYIRRNTDGGILFKDMLDFLEKPKGSKAPTVMGSMQEIPGNIDLLIAGTSCVEFSSLNSQRAKAFGKKLPNKAEGWRKPDCMKGVNLKDLDAVWKEIVTNMPSMGESTQTFISLLSYVRDYRPKIVILENVANAPFEAMSKTWFPHFAYTATYVKLDTKDFYLPQTRNRLWLVAVDNQQFSNPKAITEAWAAVVRQLKRRVSTPVSSWLLPAAHPLTERARQDDSEKALNPTSEHDWERSKSRHARTRMSERLPNGNPLTHWPLHDPVKPYDRIDRLVLKTQGSRVQDCIDIWHLRSIGNGYDMRYKISVIDLSQNIDRSKKPPPLGLSGCITPNGIPWVTTQSRLLSGYEALILQGLPINRIQFATETQEQLRDLAGNAMSITVVGANIDALLIALFQQIGPLNQIFVNRRTKAETKITRSIMEVDMVKEPFSSMNFELCDVQTVIKQVFERCRRYCFCNGSAKYSTDQFRLCKTCDTIRCNWCHGNPKHTFENTQRPADVLSLNEVDQHAMHYFPAVIPDLFSQFSANLTLDFDKYRNNTILGYPALVEALKSTVFYYHSVRVTEVVTICYQSNTAFELRVKVWEKGVTWYLYLDGWSALGKNFISALGLRTAQLRQQPVAKAHLDARDQSVIPRTNSWMPWSFKCVSVQAGFIPLNNVIVLKLGGRRSVQGDSGANIPAPFSNLVDFSSRYLKKPDCDSNQSSLHLSHNSKKFLFKDATEADSPDRDCYVVADECRQLEPHEYREVIVKFKPEEDFKNRQAIQNKHDLNFTDAKVDGVWLTINSSQGNERFDLTNVGLIARQKFLEAESLFIPQHRYRMMNTSDPDQQVLAEGVVLRHKESDQYNAIRHYEDRGEWECVSKHHMHHFWDFASPFNLKLSLVSKLEADVNITDIEEWLKKLDDWRLSFERSDYQNNSFANRSFKQLPPYQWIKLGSKYVIHYLSDAMDDFEECTKREAQAPAFEVQLKVKDGPVVSDETLQMAIRYLINFKSMGQRAATLLPPTHDSSAKIFAHSRAEPRTIMSENMRIDEKDNRHSFKPFRKSLKAIGLDFGGLLPEHPLARMQSFAVELGDLQKQSLAWMLWRELQTESEPTEHQAEFVPTERQPELKFVEREIEEDTVPELKLRLLGTAQRAICNHGGVLADDVGYGKTVVTLALIHAQKEFDKTESMKQRKRDHKNRVHLKASLVVVPNHLVDQWASEAKRFWKINNSDDGKIVRIKNIKELMDDQSWSVWKRLYNATLIIVSTDIFKNNQYHINLAKLAGSLDPPFVDEGKAKGSIKGRPFEEWYESTSQLAGDNAGRFMTSNRAQCNQLRDEVNHHRKTISKAQGSYLKDFNECSTARAMKKANDGTAEVLKASTKFPVMESNMTSDDYTHVFETFTFARVIYDEFSYDDFATTNFVKNSRAYSKWILSATPPTRDLAAICNIAKLINVHVARPIYARAGLPRITKGPELENMSNAEKLLAYKFMTDKSVTERHEQGEKFLQFFTSSNPLDRNLAGSVQVEKRIIVTELTQHEDVLYHDLQHELKAYAFDADRLSKVARDRLEPLMGHDSYKEGQDGKFVGTKALIFRASVKPKFDKVSNKKPASNPKELLTELTAERIKVIDHLKVVHDKAVWLAVRVFSRENEFKKDNAKPPALDIFHLLRQFWEGQHAALGGQGTWQLISNVLTNDMRRQEPKLNQKISADDFINILWRTRTTDWRSYYIMKRSHLGKIDEDEAEVVLNDILGIHGDDFKTIRKLYIRVRDEKEARERLGEVAEELANEEANKLEEEESEESEDEEAEEPEEEEEEAEELEKDDQSTDPDAKLPDDVKPVDEELPIRPVEDDEDPSVDSNKFQDENWTFRKILTHFFDELIGETPEDGNEESEESEDDDKGNLKKEDERKRTKKELMELFRGAGIKYDKNLKVALYRKRWSDHKKGKLHDSDYVGNSCLKKNPYPIFGSTRRLRSSDYSLTREEVSDVALEFRKLIEKADRVIKQERLISNYVEPSRGTVCDGCRKPKGADELWMVQGCGHLLCADHIKGVSCGESNSVTACQCLLQGETVLLSTLQRQPDVNQRDNDQYSTKTREMIRWIRSIPKEDNVVLFSQFDRQIDEIYTALEGNGIDCSTEPSEGCPKVRILKLNDPKSAGTNLQMVNHVMFASPLLADLQENYDASMKQAIGRCVRFGQKKVVKVWHFMARHTIEVDIYELRTRRHVTANPKRKIDANGQYVPPAAGETLPMVRVNSLLNQGDIWRAMNEQNWLTTVGIEY